MDDKKLLKLLWERAESALAILAKQYGKRLLAICAGQIPLFVGAVNLP